MTITKARHPVQIAPIEQPLQELESQYMRQKVVSHDISRSTGLILTIWAHKHVFKGHLHIVSQSSDIIAASSSQKMTNCTETQKSMCSHFDIYLLKTSGVQLGLIDDFDGNLSQEETEGNRFIYRSSTQTRFRNLNVHSAKQSGFLRFPGRSFRECKECGFK